MRDQSTQADRGTEKSHYFSGLTLSPRLPFSEAFRIGGNLCIAIITSGESFKHCCLKRIA